MVPNLGTAHAAEKFLCPIGASAVERIGVLMVDPLHFEAAEKVVPCAGFVRVNRGALGDLALMKRGLALRCETRPAANCRHARGSR